MSKVLSLKLKDEIFQDTESMRKTAKVPRNAYINKALDFFNNIQKRHLLKKRLAKESNLVSKESLHILSEFEALAETLD